MELKLWVLLQMPGTAGAVMAVPGAESSYIRLDVLCDDQVRTCRVALQIQDAQDSTLVALVKIHARMTLIAQVETRVRRNRAKLHYSTSSYY
jgi:hypothetical protein